MGNRRTIKAGIDVTFRPMSCMILAMNISTHLKRPWLIGSGNFLATGKREGMTGTTFPGSRPLGWFLGFVLLAGAIFIEALYGPTIDNRIIPNMDKMAHVAAFGFLTFLLLRYLRSIGFANGWRVLLGVGLIIIVMGVLDEWVQSMVPGRTASPMDVLADGVGAVFILLTAFMLRGKTQG